MADTTSGEDLMKQNMEEMIKLLQLSDTQKRFMRSRWLDQVLWTEAKAVSTQFRYYLLRITAIVGGVIVPALIGLNFSTAYDQYVRAAAFILGLLVAISIAVEEFFHLGERWRHYRSTVEVLKSEGWKFFQLSGRYGDYAVHGDAYREFADQVEQILNSEMTRFVSEVAVDKKASSKDGQEGSGKKTGTKAIGDPKAAVDQKPDSDAVKLSNASVEEGKAPG